MQNQATLLWVHYINDDGVDLKTYLASKLRSRDTINLQDRDDATRWQLFEVAAAYTDKVTYAEIPVIWKAGGVSLGNQQKIIAVRESSTMVVRLSVQATAPLDPVVNDIWMDTSGPATVVKVWSGSVWK
jgi:hypothetical protein